MIQTTVWVLYAEFVNATASLLKWLRRFATKSYHYRNHRLEYWLLGIQAKSSTTGFCLQFQQTPSCTWHNWTATTHHFWFFSTTEFTRPESGGLCHLVWHSATRVWDQSSWHRWAATSSTACVVRSLEQSLIDDAVDQCPTLYACLCSCQRRTFWTYFVTINLCSLCLMNFMFHTVLDAAGDVLRVHYKGSGGARKQPPRAALRRGDIGRGENMEFWNLAASDKLLFALQTVIFYTLNTP